MGGRMGAGTPEVASAPPGLDPPPGAACGAAAERLRFEAILDDPPEHLFRGRTATASREEGQAAATGWRARPQGPQPVAESAGRSTPPDPTTANLRQGGAGSSMLNWLQSGGQVPRWGMFCPAGSLFSGTDWADVPKTGLFPYVRSSCAGISPPVISSRSRCSSLLRARRFEPRVA